MPTKKFVSECEGKMKKAVEVLQNELKSFRTGVASTGLVEGIKVDYYGTKTPITQMSNISIPEPRMLIIKPWDQTQLENIKISRKFHLLSCVANFQWQKGRKNIHCNSRLHIPSTGHTHSSLILKE